MEGRWGWIAAALWRTHWAWATRSFVGPCSESAYADCSHRPSHARAEEFEFGRAVPIQGGAVERACCTSWGDDASYSRALVYGGASDVGYFAVVEDTIGVGVPVVWLSCPASASVREVALEAEIFAASANFGAAIASSNNF